MDYTDVIAQYRHPGHSAPPPGPRNSSCLAHYQVIRQLDLYLSSLGSSRVCLVGSGSSGSNSCRHVEWTLQKYYEAAAVGCVVIGDVPADATFSAFVPVRLAGLDAPTIAKRVEEAVTRHKRGEFDGIQRAASEYVRTQRSCRSVMDAFYLPALRECMRRDGVGGVFVDSAALNLTSNTECSSGERSVSVSVSVSEGGADTEGEEEEVLWSMAVSLAAPQHSGQMPAVTVAVLSGRRHQDSPEQQVWRFCSLYQVIDAHCQVLLRAMQDALGREQEGD
jgi:hypothetical protein